MPGLPNGIKYFVPAIPEWVTDEHLTNHFGQFGQVAGAAVVKDKSSDASRGFGYVTMVDESSQSAMLTTKHKFGDAVVQVLLTKDSLTGYDVKKVHLGKLDQDVPGEAIREAFSQFGLVLDVHTPKDPATGERKNFGFVTFSTDDAFNAAVQAGAVAVGNCVVTVKPAAQTGGGGGLLGKGACGEWDAWGGGWGPKGSGKDAWGCAWKGGKGDWGGGKGDWGGGWTGGWGDSWGSSGSDGGGGNFKRDGIKYFVPGLPQHVTDSDLRTHFSQYGTVVDAAVVKEKGSEASRGFGYVTFIDESSQAAVLGEKHQFGNSMVSVMLTKDSLVGNNVKKVHLGNLPIHMPVDTIRDAFSKFGLVIDVHTPKDPQTGERKNFGFVTFAGDDAFNAAITQRHVMVEGHELYVKPAAQSRGDGGYGSGKGSGKGTGKEAGWGYWDGPSAWGWDPWSSGWDQSWWGSSCDSWGKGGGKWGGSKGYYEAAGPYSGGYDSKGYDAKGSYGSKGGDYDGGKGWSDCKGGYGSTSGCGAMSGYETMGGYNGGKGWGGSQTGHEAKGSFDGKGGCDAKGGYDASGGYGGTGGYDAKGGADAKGSYDAKGGCFDSRGAHAGKGGCSNLGGLDGKGWGDGLGSFGTTGMPDAAGGSGAWGQGGSGGGDWGKGCSDGGCGSWAAGAGTWGAADGCGSWTAPAACSGGGKGCQVACGGQMAAWTTEDWGAQAGWSGGNAGCGAWAQGPMGAGAAYGPQTGMGAHFALPAPY